jgi:hypothetical protein
MMYAIIPPSGLYRTMNTGVDKRNNYNKQTTSILPAPVFLGFYYQRQKLRPEDSPEVLGI